MKHTSPFALVVAIVLIVTIIPAVPAEAQSTISYAYVANQFDTSVSVVDTATNTEVAVVPVSSYTKAVAVTPDGSFVWALGDRVNVIDTTTNTVVDTINLGSIAWGAAFTADGSRAYVSVTLSAVKVIDRETNTVMDSIATAGTAGAIAITPDNAQVYVSVGDNVVVIDTAANTISQTIPVAHFPRDIEITPDGQKVYVTNQNSDLVTVIETSTNTVLTTIPVGDTPWGICVTSDGSLAIVANLFSHDATIIDIASDTVISTVAVGQHPTGAAAIGSSAYVANQGDDTVSVIDSTNGTVTATVAVGDGPIALAAEPAVAAPRPPADPIYEVLHEFDQPFFFGSLKSELLVGSDGRLYGATYQGGLYGYGTIFAVETDGSGFQIIHNFDDQADGAFPTGSLIQDSSGRIYGTTQYGGQRGAGSVFGVDPDGLGFEVLHFFSSSDPNDGAIPNPRLVIDNTGKLFGTTHRGGQHGQGTVFGIDPDGSGFDVLHNFGSNDSEDGGSPSAGLALDEFGRLFGTTEYGGQNSFGTIFAIDADGSEFQVLHSFDLTDGVNPRGKLILDESGMLFGTALAGGQHWQGTVFTIKRDGSGFQVVNSFDGVNGGYPQAGLVQNDSGALLGTTYSGGTYAYGTIFTIDPDGSGFEVLHNFDYSDSGNGAYPNAGLAQDDAGRLFGSTLYGGEDGVGAIFSWDASAGFELLFSLPQSAASNPRAGLTMNLTAGTSGRLFGTTDSGGQHGYGTVFAIDADGSGFQILHNFDYWVDGGQPYAGLAQDDSGRLFGTTSSGGQPNQGTIFAIDPDGTGFAVIHSFDHNDPNEGARPFAGLVLDDSGSLFGTTYSGGRNGQGTVFTIDADGSRFQVLHSFDYYDPDNGAYPYAGLVFDDSGRLFGTTSYGGQYGYGTVFAIDPDGLDFEVLHSFDSTNGAQPYAGLILGDSGSLFGTTVSGGQQGHGTVFAVDPYEDQFEILHSFYSWDSANGGRPYAGLIQDDFGRLFGTTLLGGQYGYGAIFTIEPDGSGFNVFHSFDFTDGGNPWAGLVEDVSRNLYGTTFAGGSGGGGVVYRLIFDLNPMAPNQAVTTEEDVSLAILLTASDPRGNGLGFSVISHPANGVLSGSGPNLIYTPNLNWYGTDSLIFTATDGTLVSDRASVTIVVSPVNDLPVLAPIADQSVEEGQILQITLAASDVEGGSITFSAIGMPPGADTDPVAGEFDYAPEFDVSTEVTNTYFDIQFQATDSSGGVGTQIVQITVIDVNGGTPPSDDPVVVEPIDPVTGTSSVTIEFAGVQSGGVTTVTTASGGPPPPAGFKLGNNNYLEIDTTAVVDPPIKLCFNYSSFGIKANQESKLTVIHIVPEGQVRIDGTVCAKPNGCVDDITDPNDPPDYSNPDEDNDIICGTSNSLSPFAVAEAIEIDGPLDPVSVDTEILTSLDLGDLNAVDSAEWEWADGSTSPAIITGGLVEGTHQYASAGIYTPTLTLIESGREVGSAEFKYIVVYDPDGGFVTGGGWIQSPAGAYAPDSTLEGRANFGFVAKYKKGQSVPDGQTQFQFAAADLDFHSTAYQWLVIAGKRTQFKGEGEINGDAGYGFMLSAIDGDLNGGDGIDRFRVKIWTVADDIVIYDNQMAGEDDAEPQTELGGGAVVIHSGKGQ